jgi:hypothetical protein
MNTEIAVLREIRYLITEYRPGGRHLIEDAGTVCALATYLFHELNTKGLLNIEKVADDC